MEGALQQAGGWSQNSSLHQRETVETSLRDSLHILETTKGSDRDYQVQLRCASGTFVLVFIDFYSTDCLIGFIFQNKSCKCYNSPLKVSSVKLMNLTSLN